MKKLIFSTLCFSVSFSSISLAQLKKDSTQSSASVLQLKRKDLVGSAKPVRFSCIKDQAFVVFGKYAIKIEKKADGNRDMLRCDTQDTQKSTSTKYRSKIEEYFVTGNCPGKWVPFTGNLTKVMSYGKRFNNAGLNFDQILSGVGTDKISTSIIQDDSNYDKVLTLKFSEDGSVSIFNSSKAAKGKSAIIYTSEEIKENCIGKVMASDICGNPEFKPVTHAPAKECKDLGAKTSSSNTSKSNDKTKVRN